VEWTESEKQAVFLGKGQAD